MSLGERISWLRLAFLSPGVGGVLARGSLGSLTIRVAATLLVFAFQQRDNAIHRIASLRGARGGQHLQPQRARQCATIMDRNVQIGQLFSSRARHIDRRAR